MLLTRRFFLLGSAAAVAVAAVPLRLVAPVTPVVSPAPFARRLITELMLTPCEGLSPDHPISFQLSRPGQDSLLHQISIHPYGRYRWVDCGNPEFSIVVPKAQALITDVQHPDINLGNGMAEITLVCTDFDERGWMRRLVETHRFGAERRVTTNPMDVIDEDYHEPKPTDYIDLVDEPVDRGEDEGEDDLDA
jgi:hypothetical protein